MIDPYFTHGAVTLYKGDCRAVLREIAPESVALLLTDPPYGIAVESEQFENAAGKALRDAEVKRIFTLTSLARMTRTALSPLTPKPSSRFHRVKVSTRRRSANLNATSARISRKG